MAPCPTLSAGASHVERTSIIGRVYSLVTGSIRPQIQFELFCSQNCRAAVRQKIRWTWQIENRSGFAEDRLASNGDRIYRVTSWLFLEFARGVDAGGER